MYTMDDYFNALRELQSVANALSNKADSFASIGNTYMADYLDEKVSLIEANIELINTYNSQRLNEQVKESQKQIDTMFSIVLENSLNPERITHELEVISND